MVIEKIRSRPLSNPVPVEGADLLDPKSLAIETIRRQLSSEQDYRNMSAVLLSLRRITALLRTSRGIVNSPSYTNPNVECENIKADLASFFGIDLAETEIQQALRSVSGLEEACIPLAERAARLARFRSELDSDELIWFANKGVERAIWDIWDPPALEDAPQRLTHVVNAYLYHLPQYADRQANYGLRNRRVRSLESFGEDDHGNTVRSWDERLRIPDQGIIFTTVHDKGTFGKTIERWYSLVNKMNLAQVFSLISQLGKPQQIAMLDYFHYIPNPATPRTYRLLAYGMSRTTYERHFVEGVEACKAYLDDHGGSPPAAVIPISQIINNLGPLRVYQMREGGAAHHDSFRVALVEAAKGGTLTAIQSSLTLRQREIIDHAVELGEDGVTLRYSTAEIAERIGITEGSVNEHLATVHRLCTSGEKRYVSRPGASGSIIPSESNHARLIRMREQGVTPMQRASLTQQMQDVFDLLTTPDDQDVYPRYADVQRLIPSRSRDIPKDLCGALENAQWVETLNTQISLALNGDRNRFTEDEVRLLEELHRRVQRGEPIRSQSQTGPAWTAIAKQINIASYKGLAVSRKLRGLYGALG